MNDSRTGGKVTVVRSVITRVAMGSVLGLVSLLCISPVTLSYSDILKGFLLYAGLFTRAFMKCIPAFLGDLSIGDLK